MASVLFVSHSKRAAFYYNDASARYRCVFPAEHLNELGITCHVIHFTQIHKIQLHDYSHVIFHRPQYSLKLKYYLYKMKRLAIKAIIDFDDLLFNPQLAKQSAAVQAGYMNLRLAKKHATAYSKALQLFDHAWVSTKPLAKQLKISYPCIKITVCHNKLPKRWAKLQAQTPWQERLKNKVIRYMPGTSHHKHDFEKIEQTLITLLNNNSDIKLEIVGDLKFNIDNFPTKQVSQQSHMTFEQLPSVISSSWLTLAPLQDNIFNQCKSGLKFWESGLYGVPVISSLLEDIERFKNSGLCLSLEQGDWIDYIEKMKKPDNYQAASEDAYTFSGKALFSKNILDSRLTGLNINVNKKPEKIENHDDAYIQQLIMCAKFGPRWPAICLNPADQQYQQANETLDNLKRTNNKFSTTDITKLKQEELDKIKQDKPTKKHKVIRKAKKLWNSPYDFFKDMKL